VEGCLSEAGVTQARTAAEALKNERIDIVYSSPYGRALQTAEIVTAGRGLEVRVLPFMHEWMLHERYRNLPDDEWDALMEADGELYAEHSWGSRIGEGYYDMCARIIPGFLAEMDKIGIHPRHGGYVPDEGAKELSVAVFAHGGSLGVLAGFLLGVRPFPVSGFSFGFTGVAKFGFAEKRGVFYPQLRISSYKP
jgi:broad specificity phosphatase PhoE